MPLRIVAILTAVLICIDSVSSQPPTYLPNSNAVPDLRCGAACLYIGLRALDAPVSSLAEIEQQLGPASNIGYSLEQLQTVAQMHSVNTLAVLTSLKNLSRRDRPFACVAHLRDGHFVMIGDVANGKVFVVNPSGSAMEVPEATLMGQWDRKALILSKAALTPEENIAQDFPVAAVWVVVTALLLSIGVLWWGRMGFWRRTNSVQQKSS